MASEYKAAVIGGGMIGAQMDAAARSARPQTHAGGYYNNANFDLVALCDPRPCEQLKQWECRIYREPAELLASENPDVLSVCVPEQQQYEVLKEVLDYSGIQAVIAEKPLADGIEKSREIVEAYEAAGIPLLVNYTRRYSLMYQDMAQRFQREEEHVISSSIRYAKGLWHNGSHALDLALLLFGRVQEVYPLSKTHDFYESDPSVSAFLKFERCPNFFMQALDERYYTLFEVDIFTDQKRYIINQDHREIKIFETRGGVGIPLGKRLIYVETLQTDYESCMSGLMNNLYNVLQMKAKPLCTGQDALKALELADELDSNHE